MEELLEGGNTHTGVVRIGSTVRRPTGPWTPGVHALLRHLESGGFDAAPRVLGVDEQDREILTFVEGAVVWPDHFALVSDDTALAEVAACIRAYHGAIAGFPDAGAYAWSDRGGDQVGPAEVLCHNDLAPWNLVHRPDGRWAFIDWDLASPGRRAWDLAWALLSFVPLMPSSTLDDGDTRRRIAVFRDAYRAELFPADILEVAIERCEREAGLIRDLGARGEEPYVRLLAEGHGEIWAEAAEHVRRRLPSWRLG